MSAPTKLPSQPVEPATTRSSQPISWSGWLAAIALALVAAYFGVHYFASRSETVLSVQDAELARTEAQGLALRLEAERILGSSYIATLQKAADPANLTIIRLADPADASNSAVAFLIWNPQVRQGVLLADKLPVLAADNDYHLWLTASGGNEAVRVAVFTVEDSGVARVPFHLDRNLTTGVFTITCEPKGGSLKPTLPVIASGSL